MKKRLLLVGVGAGLLAVVWYQGAARPPKQVLSFNPPGCFLPCVMGIVPGQTNFDQAMAMISAIVPKQQRVRDGEFWVTQDAGPPVFITLEKQDPRVGNYPKRLWVSTYSKGQVTTLGKMLDAGYIPTHVFRSSINGPNSVTLLVEFTPQVLAVVTGNGQIYPDSAIDEIIVVSDKTETETIRATRRFNDEVDWFGYAPIESYLDAPPK